MAIRCELPKVDRRAKTSPGRDQTRQLPNSLMEQPSSNRRPTIVGGSPMNRLVQASGLPLNVERLLIQAALSHEFRRRLLTDREAAAAEAGIDLLPEERKLLSHINNETLERTIDVVIMPPVSRKKFLKRAASSVVLALAGSALLTQAACGGASPDRPSSAHDKPGHYWANLAGMRCFVFVPELYAPRVYEMHPTPLLLALPGANQTSLEAANQWINMCSQEEIILDQEGVHPRRGNGHAVAGSWHS